MRFLLSTVAATALMASPALAQTLDNDITQSPEAAEPMGPGVDFSQLEQDLSGAGFTDAQQLDRAEIYRSTYQGQQALVIIMDEDDAGLAMEDPIGDPDVTAAVPEDDEFEDDLAAGPAEPGIDDDLAEAPVDPAVPEDDDLAADPAFPEDDDLAEAPDMDDPDVTATTPGVGVEDDLSQAGFEMPERSEDGQVFRTTTEDGRTMFIVLAGDMGGPGVGPAEPGMTPDEPELDPADPADPAEPDLEQID